MERVILSDLEKHKEELRNKLVSDFPDKLNEQDDNNIVKYLDGFVFHLVEMLKGRKTAHEKFFSDIILNSVDGIIGYDSQNKIFIWNKGAENIFGYTKQEVLGRDIKMLVPSDLEKRGESDFLEKQLTEHGFISNFETKRISKSGEVRDVSISRFIVKNEQYEVIGNVTIERDITTEKKLEKELREKENLALIGTVVSSIAHNLSNPLNIISGNADYLLLDRKDRDEGYEELKVIVQETTRITKGIRQILNFSRPVILTKEKINIQSLIQNILSSVNYLISEQKEICIETEFGENLPEILIDKEQVKDVLLNLLTNAIQAIKIKGIISIKTSKKFIENIHGKEYLGIEISDSGGGISPKDLPHIFTPFFSTKEYGKGTGLGLAFAERVIKEHHGTIEVTSTVGKGTTFSLNIPFS